MWTPQHGPQTAAILTATFIDELFFGGAVGGGKTDFLLGDFGQDVGVGYGPAWRGILFRRTYGELEEIIGRALELYPLWFPGAVYTSSDKTWIFPGGESLKLRYLEHSNDWMRYWGHQFTWEGWDELPSWADLTPYHKMKARLRSAAGVPCKRIRSTGNPGGPGHQAVKAYFRIDHHPLGNVPIRDEATGTTRMFIRSRVRDNQILMANDPGYVDRLRGLGSSELVRAWLEGDWSVVQGAFFDNWSPAKHVVRPFTIPDSWSRFMSGDWGSAKPFSFGWWALVEDDYTTPEGLTLPRGSLVRYREWYGAKRDDQGVTIPNAGLKMHAEAVGEGLLERGGAGMCWLDPSAFAEDGGPSIEERLRDGCNGKINFVPADNKRVPRDGAMGGWDQVRARLEGDDDGNPMIVFFETCADTIRTLPALQHDELRPEDVDTDGEDHAPDDVRYACMSRPWLKPKTQAVKPKRRDYARHETTGVSSLKVA